MNRHQETSPKKPQRFEPVKRSDESVFALGEMVGMSHLQRITPIRNTRVKIRCKCVKKGLSNCDIVTHLVDILPLYSALE